jgi:hypothetical protein
MTKWQSMICAGPLVLALLGTARGEPPSSPPAAPEPPHAIVVHVAPSSSEPGADIELEAAIDAPFAETLSVRWRPIGDAAWRDVPFARSSAGGWFVSLPAPQPPGIEYYVRGQDARGAEVAHFATAEAPHVVRVEPSLFDRLESLDRERLRGHENQLALEVFGHNFGNRYDLADRFVRSELSYTHRWSRPLYHVTFGFGSISGKTPVVSAEDGMSVGHALRYGFGEVRLRVHPSVFLDGRLALGVSQEGFAQGAGGAITFGKPWRSNLAIGGEFLRDLGGTAWIRLQWDTAPPFLMAASIVRTDLPGAVIARAGLYVAYDLTYQLADRLTLRAQLSYGGRDGVAHVGGGLGTAVDF